MLLATKKFSAETCGIEGEDRRDLIRILAMVFGAIGLLAFILRCTARLIGPHDWGHDDTVMCFVMVCIRELGPNSSGFSNLLYRSWRLASQVSPSLVRYLP